MTINMTRILFTVKQITKYALNYLKTLIKDLKDYIKNKFLSLKKLLK